VSGREKLCICVCGDVLYELIRKDCIEIDHVLGLRTGDPVMGQVLGIAGRNSAKACRLEPVNYVTNSN
jgi:hypothetical protein